MRVVFPMALLLWNLAVSSAMAEPIPFPTYPNLVYAPGSPMQRLDLYVPSGRGPFPVVLFIHGGGWTRGDKQSITRFGRYQILEALLKHDYAVAAINYRLGADAVFPAQLNDVKTAVRFLRAKAAKLNLAPDAFATLGQSAGAHLAQLLGVTADVHSLEGKDKGYPDQSSRVQAVISEFGTSELLTIPADRKAQGCPRWWAKIGLAHLLGGPPVSAEIRNRAVRASPLTYVNAKDPPFLLIHGDHDCVIPAAQSERMERALRNVGVEAEFVLVNGEHGDPFHATINASPVFASPSVLAKMIDFLDRYLVRR